MLHLLFSYVLKQIGRKSFSSYIYAYLHIYRIQIYLYIHLCIPPKVLFILFEDWFKMEGLREAVHVIVAWTASTFCSFWKIPRESFRCRHSIGTEQVSGGLRPPEQPQGHEGLQGHEGPSQDVTWMVQNRAFPMKALLRVQTSLHPYQKEQLW